MNKIVIACSLLLLLPAAWGQGSPVRPEKAQRQALRREMLKEQKPVEPNLREQQAQRRADLRAALLAKRPPEQQQGESNKHLTPSERMELRQQLRQQQLERQGKGG